MHLCDEGGADVEREAVGAAKPRQVMSENEESPWQMLQALLVCVLPCIQDRQQSANTCLRTTWIIFSVSLIDIADN